MHTKQTQNTPNNQQGDAMYTIDKGVELPKVDRSKHGRVNKYPFGSMEVGDSFSFAESDKRKLQNACCIYGKRNNKFFLIRKDDLGTYRCWRIE